MRAIQRAAKLSATNQFEDLVGAPPTMRSSQDLWDEVPHPENRRRVPKIYTDAPAKAGIRLQAVANACAAHGLDPAVEIPAILAATKPMLDRDGKPVLDPVTGEPMMEPILDAEVRLKTFLSLLEYLQPKLRSTEVKVSGSLELTNEQLDARLKMLLAKTQAD